MENSQPPKSDDVLKGADKKTGEHGADLSSIPRLSETFLGVDVPLSEQASAEAGDDSEEKDEKRSKKKKSDKVFSRFLPQPDLVESGPDEEQAKSSWATKVSDLLGITSSNDELADDQELPRVSAPEEVFPDDYATGVPEAAYPRSTQEQPAEPLEAPQQVPEVFSVPEPALTAEQPQEGPERGQAQPADAGGEGGPPPETPQGGAEAPVPEPRPESVQAILARQSADTLDTPGHTPAEQQSSQVVNNYYQRTDLIPALVVDQLSRRRDRKIRRHNRAQDRTLASVQRQVDKLSNNVEVQQRTATEQVVAPARPSAEQILQQTSTIERTPDLVVSRSEALIPQVKQAGERIGPEGARPVQKERVEHKIEPSPIAAEQVQKVVEAAAEAAVPIETLYEMRHEIKGNEDFSAAADAAIRSRSSYSNNELHDMISQNIEQQINTQPTNKQADPKSQIYSQAAKGGAVAAFAFLIAFLILYFLLLRP